MAGGGKGNETGQLFSFTWHPYAVDPNVDYSKEEPTVVEFRLQPIASGTLLVIAEAGSTRFRRIDAWERCTHELRRMGGTDAEHRQPCRQNRVVGQAARQAYHQPFSQPQAM